MMKLYHEVVDECSEESADVGHDPRDPEEVIGGGEREVTEASHQGQKAAAI